jgi:hypothetical protein
MSSTYSPNLALSLIDSGTEAGLWGSITNDNLGTLLEQAVSGYVTQAVVTGTNTAITIPNGGTGVARNMYIELTGTGGTSTNLLVPANRKLYFIFNNSTGAVTVKVTGLTGVSVPAARKMLLVCNGTDVVDAVTYFSTLVTGTFTASSVTSTGAVVTTLVSVTGAVVSGNGINAPASTTLGFVSNAVQRGTVNSTGNWNIVAPSAGITFTINGIAGTHSTQIADNNNVKIDAGYLGIPQNAQTSAYAPTLQDRGKHISITTGGVTVNANPFTYGAVSATTWTAGDSFVIYNNSASSQTITAGASVTFRLTGTATTGNRTIAQYGLASVLCVIGGATPTFVINGAGVT